MLSTYASGGSSSTTSSSSSIASVFYSSSTQYSAVYQYYLLVVFVFFPPAREMSPRKKMEHNIPNNGASVRVCTRGAGVSSQIIDPTCTSHQTRLLRPREERMSSLISHGMAVVCGVVVWHCAIVWLVLWAVSGLNLVQMHMAQHGDTRTQLIQYDMQLIKIVSRYLVEPSKAHVLSRYWRC